eukprot:567003-Amphidinium_carterae.1
MLGPTPTVAQGSSCLCSSKKQQCLRINLKLVGGVISMQDGRSRSPSVRSPIGTLWASSLQRRVGVGVCERAFLLECVSFHVMPCAVRPGTLFPSRQIHGTAGHRLNLPVRQQYKQTWEQGF